MDLKLQNELYHIDPIFFEHAINCQEGKENEMTTCMYFGCQCGNGWFEPIKNFVKKISIINNIAKQHNAKIVCDQLKEKFGTCTIYYSCKLIDENKEVDDQELVDILYSMVNEAYKKCENECWNVCEWCGAEGGFKGENLITTKGWVSRICKKCAKAKAEKETRHYDEINNQEYIPRITWFQEGYEFLNPYYITGFNYNNNYYHSIIEAFYCEKDNIHKKIYQNISMLNNQNNSSLIEMIANEFKIEMKEEDYSLLKGIVKSQFTYKYNKNIKQELLETKGKILQNMGRHHNNIWGYCICDECKYKEHKDLYSKILMEIRDELIKINERTITHGDIGWKNNKYYIYGNNNEINKKEDWYEIDSIKCYKYMEENNISDDDIIILFN